MISRWWIRGICPDHPTNPGIGQSQFARERHMENGPYSLVWRRQESITADSARDEWSIVVTGGENRTKQWINKGVRWAYYYEGKMTYVKGSMNDGMPYFLVRRLT